jgi:KaiC/GvpD/RAD55 family RecA-like ATPase
MKTQYAVVGIDDDQLRELIDDVPIGSTILLLGPPGVGKTAFCERLLYYSLKNHTSVLYVILDHPPSRIRDRLKNKGLTCSEGTNRLTLVDGYSWLIGESEERYRVNNLSNLNDLNAKLISVLDDVSAPFRFILDSISTLLIYNSENEAVHFLERKIARMKHSNNVSIWLLESGIHSCQFYTTLRNMVDYVLEMRFEEQTK